MEWRFLRVVFESKPAFNGRRWGNCHECFTICSGEGPGHSSAMSGHLSTAWSHKTNKSCQQPSERNCVQSLWENKDLGDKGWAEQGITNVRKTCLVFCLMNKERRRLHWEKTRLLHVSVQMELAPALQTSLTAVLQEQVPFKLKHASLSGWEGGSSVMMQGGPYPVWCFSAASWPGSETPKPKLQTPVSDGHQRWLVSTQNGVKNNKNRSWNNRFWLTRGRWKQQTPHRLWQVLGDAFWCWRKKFDSITLSSLGSALLPVGLVE